MSASWHPDGKRISVWTWEPNLGPAFGQYQLPAAWRINLKIAPEVARHLSEASVDSGVEPTLDLESSWAPSGRAIYFERAFRGARNLWKMTIDPKTRAATAIERVTTGPGSRHGTRRFRRWKKAGLYGRKSACPGLAFPFRRLSWSPNWCAQAGYPTWNRSHGGKICRGTARDWLFVASVPANGRCGRNRCQTGEEVPVLADDYKRNCRSGLPMVSACVLAL